MAMAKMRTGFVMGSAKGIGTVHEEGWGTDECLI
jgi:hypothetical protein